MPVWDKAAFDQFYRTGAEKHGHWNGRDGILLHYHYWSIGQYQRGRYAGLLAGVLSLNAGDSVALVGAGFNWTGEGLGDLGVDVIGTEISAYILGEQGNTEEAEIRQHCLDAGIDPDVDKIYCVPSDPGAALTLDVNRVEATEKWLTARSELHSRESWIAVHGRLPNRAQVSTVPNEHLGNWQWMRDPLELFLRGGRAAPQVRGSGTVIDEDLETRQSRDRVFNAMANSPRYVISEEVLNGTDDVAGLRLCDDMRRLITERSGTVIHMLSPLQSRKQGAPELNWKTYADWRTHLDDNGFATQMILPTVTAGGVVAYSGLI